MDSKSKEQIADSILDLIGNTPLLNLSRIYNGPGIFFNLFKNWLFINNVNN